jgi:hypothetical protein
MRNRPLGVLVVVTAVLLAPASAEASTGIPDTLGGGSMLQIRPLTPVDDPRAPNPTSESLAMSPNGRFLLYRHVPWVWEVPSPVFVRDLQTGIEREVPGIAREKPYPHAVSDDGRYVLVASQDDLAGEGRTGMELYRRDLDAGTVKRVSVLPEGASEGNVSQLARMSADGRYVGFAVAVPRDENGRAPGTSATLSRNRLSGTA